MTPIYEYRVILPYPDEPRILLLQKESGWSLPGWQTSKFELWQSVEPVNQIVRDLFGVETFTLRMVYDSFEPSTETSLRVYELEPQNVPSEWRFPENARWIERQDLAVLTLADPQLQSIIRDWFEEAENGLPFARRPWARPGWFAKAANWIEARLEDLQIKRLGPIAQLRTWERSCVLRMPTEIGTLYFKAVPAWFSQEIQVELALAQAFPANLPQILAVDREQGWMLVRDFGGRPLTNVPQIDRWEEAARRLAQLQKHSAQHLPGFQELNCPDLSLAAISSKLTDFLANLETYTTNRWISLQSEEIERLTRLAPRLTGWYDELAGYNLPTALEHGDLWPDNIIVTANNFIFFDWSDCNLSHPFFSLGLLLNEADNSDEALRQARRETPDWAERVKQAYLTEWSEYGSLEQLQLALKLALKLAPLHHALNYHYFILPNMEARWEMESMVPFYLRMLLTEI